MHKIGKKHISPRANLRWQVNAVTPKGPLDGVTKNISTTGAYVCCARPLRLNEVFHMSINSPEKSLNVKAEVARTGCLVQAEFSTKGFLTLDSHGHDLIALLDVSVGDPLSGGSADQ